MKAKKSLILFLVSCLSLLMALSQVKDKDDFTLMFVLGRAAMNFIDLCGVHTCYATVDTAPESLLLSIGLKKQVDGTFFADMTGMFTGGCCSCKK